MNILVVMLAREAQAEVLPGLQTWLWACRRFRVVGAASTADALWWLREDEDIGLVIVDLNQFGNDEAIDLAKTVAETGRPVIFINTNPLLSTEPSHVVHSHATIHYCRFEVGRGYDSNPGIGAFMREVTEQITAQPATATV